jgi:hypothetical protein
MMGKDSSRIVPIFLIFALIFSATNVHG